MKLARGVLSFIPVLCALGCTIIETDTYEHPDAKNRTSAYSRFDLIPPSIRMFEMQVGGRPESKPEWSREIEKAFLKILTERFSEEGIQIAPYKGVEVDTREYVEAGGQFQALVRAIEFQEQYGFSAGKRFTMGRYSKVLAPEESIEALIWVGGISWKSSSGKRAAAVWKALLFGQAEQHADTRLWLAIIDAKSGDIIWVCALKSKDAALDNESFRESCVAAFLMEWRKMRKIHAPKTK